MRKDEFIKLLESAKEDKYGNLYIEDNSLIHDNPPKVYFGTMSTVCDDLADVYCYNEKDKSSLTDWHFWNDDTLSLEMVRKN